MTTIRELMGRITQGEWRTHSDETLTVRDKNDGCVFSIGWLTGRQSGPRRSHAEASANAAAATALPQLLALAAAVKDYARSMIRVRRDGTGYMCAFCGASDIKEKDIDHEDDCPLVALAALQAKLEAK